MTNKSKQDRRISIGGNTGNSVIISGDNNTVKQRTSVRQELQTHTEGVSLEEAKASLAEIKAILANMQLQPVNQITVDSQISAAEKYLELDDKQEAMIGNALQTALKAIQEEKEFNAYKNELQNPLQKITRWLGENWMHLISLVSLAK